MSVCMSACTANAAAVSVSTVTVEDLCTFTTHCCTFASFIYSDIKQWHDVNTVMGRKTQLIILLNLIWVKMIFEWPTIT